MKPIKGWWFSKGYKLLHGDGREIEVGITHKVEGEIIPCKNALHMSIKPLDALKYAPGPIVWKVEASGEIIPHNNDKLASSERTYISGGIDVSETLREFARLCALDVVDLWDCPEVVLKYLKTGDEKLRSAAYSSAYATDAGRAAYSAAYATDAGRAAVNAAAYAAAYATDAAAYATAYATDAVAYAAAYAVGAAYVAADAAAQEKQNQRLLKMLNKEIKKNETN